MSVIKRIRNGVEDPCYTVRLQWQGKDRWIATGATVKEEAEKLEREIKRELRAGRIPAILDQLKARHELTIGGLIDDYIAAGCPDRKMQIRAGDNLEAEKGILATVRDWWAGKNPNMVTQADCDEYWAHRKRQVQGNQTRPTSLRTGDRTTEIELTKLSNVLNWATRARRIEFNRLAHRPAYRDPKKIVHCRDRMPLSGDELHTLAATLLQSRQSEVLGWQLLLEAFTGCRTDEVQRLRTDANRIGLVTQPGFTDDKFLYIARAKNGVNPQVRLDDPERPYIGLLLQKIRAWKALRYPKSDWLLPGRGGDETVSDCALTHALHSICPKLKLPPRTSHGMRAYYCTARRCQGTSDPQIAWEMGQGSGPDLIRTTYGDPPANWQGLANTFTWLPNTSAVKPAWDVWAELNADAPQNLVQLTA